MNRTENGSNWSAYDSSDNSEENSEEKEEESEESKEKSTPKKKESDDGYVKPQGVTVESGLDNSGLFIILVCTLSALTLTILLIVYKRKKNEEEV